MRRVRIVALAAAVAAAFAVSGCEDSNPCESLLLVGKVWVPIEEDDGTVVEVNGEEAVCQDGDPVYR